MTADAGDQVKHTDKLQQQVAVAMTTMDAEDKYKKANDLLSEVDANIVKTATLRKQMPIKCAQLFARQCRFQYKAVVRCVCHFVLLMLYN